MRRWDRVRAKITAPSLQKFTWLYGNLKNLFFNNNNEKASWKQFHVKLLVCCLCLDFAILNGLIGCNYWFRPNHKIINVILSFLTISVAIQFHWIFAEKMPNVMKISKPVKLFYKPTLCVFYKMKAKQNSANKM